MKERLQVPASLALGEAYVDHRIEDRGRYPSIDQRCLSASSKQLFTRKDYLKWLAKERKTYEKQKQKKISMRIGHD